MPDNIRASDIDRARVTDLLDAAYADGRLTLEEHRDRVAHALAARTFAELGPLTVDLGVSGGANGGATDAYGADPYGADPYGAGQTGLPAVSGAGAAPVPTGPGAVARPRGVVVDPSTESPRDLVVAVFSAAERKGVVRIPRGTTAIALFGGASIDLREAVFESRTITIDAYAVFGGLEVVVPDGVRVVNQVFPLFGGASSQARCADPNAPTVILRGLAAFGAVAVTMKPSDE